MMQMHVFTVQRTAAHAEQVRRSVHAKPVGWLQDREGAPYRSPHPRASTEPHGWVCASAAHRHETRRINSPPAALMYPAPRHTGTPRLSSRQAHHGGVGQEADTHWPITRGKAAHAASQHMRIPAHTAP